MMLEAQVAGLQIHYCRQEQRNMHVEHALFLGPLQLCCSR